MILCSGEALIDMVPVTAPSGHPAFEPHCGGAVFNTAIALGRLGAPAALISGVSNDVFGAMLCDALQASNVATELLIRSDRPTTLAMIHLQDGHATYSFYDENSAGRMIAPADIPALPNTATAAFFGGISLCMTPVADTLVGFAERIQDQLPIMVDPNIRPGFAEDEAAYRARITRILACADLVKLSDDDLDWLYPDMSEPQKRAALLASGPATAFITRGGHGAEAWMQDGTTVKVRAPQTEVVDTIGAGDTFNAGILAHLHGAGQLRKDAIRSLSADTLRAAMTLAVRAAAVTVSRAGADAPWRGDLPLLSSD